MPCLLTLLLLIKAGRQAGSAGKRSALWPFTASLGYSTQELELGAVIQENSRDVTHHVPGKGKGKCVLWEDPMYAMSARMTGSATPAFAKTTRDSPEVIIPNMV
jgi:hypothetical protein